jgi:glycine/D-amino acid oxidase-like deaminating enzyme
MRASLGTSLWHATLPPEERTPRPSLPGDVVADVAIVGAGYTGLWTAYALHRVDPSLRIVICERETAGFGASGRNGGWCSSFFAGSRHATARRHGRRAAVTMQRAMFATLDHIERAISDERIDCDWVRGGSIDVARLPVHVARLRRQIDTERAWGFAADDYRWLDPVDASAIIGCTSNLGAIFTPHCAAMHPAKFARGLARAVERDGVTIYEHTPVVAIEAGGVRTAHGNVQADVVVRATEAFTVDLPKQRRTIAPVYSLMIATEPLPDDVWAEAKLDTRPTFTDARHTIIYGQRTADGRFAFGGRGAPYHFGSRIRPKFDTNAGVFSALLTTLRTLFPVIGDAQITHRWGGAVGVPRDWYPSVGFDRASGLAWAGGYVGDGVSTTNLAGRTLADLICDRDTDLVRLPWVNHTSPQWEPEPMRWLGINAGRLLARSLDNAEHRGREPKRRARLAAKMIGES